MLTQQVLSQVLGGKQPKHHGYGDEAKDDVVLSSFPTHIRNTRPPSIPGNHQATTRQQLPVIMFTPWCHEVKKNTSSISFYSNSYSSTIISSFSALHYLWLMLLYCTLHRISNEMEWHDDGVSLENTTSTTPFSLSGCMVAFNMTSTLMGTFGWQLRWS